MDDRHRATIESLIDVGVDGIITDRPDLLRTITAEHHFKLPKPYHRTHEGT